MPLEFAVASDILAPDGSILIYGGSRATIAIRHSRRSSRKWLFSRPSLELDGHAGVSFQNGTILPLAVHVEDAQPFRIKRGHAILGSVGTRKMLRSFAIYFGLGMVTVPVVVAFRPASAREIITVAAACTSATKLALLWLKEHREDLLLPAGFRLEVTLDEDAILPEGGGLE